jgi:general secretion pathway protein B
MSFILDALRKSEQERQHGQVPIVSSVPLAVPQTRTPAWVGILIFCLCAVVAGLGWFWWQDRQAYSAQELERPAMAETRTAPPIGGGAGAPSTSLLRLAEPAAGAARPRPSPTSPASPATPPDTAEPIGSTETPADAPASPTRGELLAQGIEVPPLDLQLHVYSDEGARRFVFLNGVKYVEGDSLPGGPRVLEITPEGVRLQQSGREFFLARN